MDGSVFEIRMPTDLPDTSLSFKWTSVPLKTLINPNFQSKNFRSCEIKQISLKSTIEDQFNGNNFTFLIFRLLSLTLHFESLRFSILQNLMDQRFCGCII